MNKKSLSVFLSVALVGPGEPPAIPVEYRGSSLAKTLTLKQTTEQHQTDEIIPDVDSTLIPSLVGGCGVNWNENLGATDFPDVRAWAPYDLDPGSHGAYYYDERFKPEFCSLDSNLTGRDIGLKYAFERKYYGNKVVAIVDSGLGQSFEYRERDDGELGELVIRYHRDLDGRRWENRDEVYGNGIDDDNNGYVDDRYGYDFYYDTGDTTSIRSPYTTRHGMNMGRVVAGNINDTSWINYRFEPRDRPWPMISALGVCPECKLMDVKVWGEGDERNYSKNVTGEAIRYAVDNGADVILLAQGFNGITLPSRYQMDGSYTTDLIDEYFRLWYEPELPEALQYAWEGGVLVVGAAGNKNQGTQTSLEKAHYNTVTNHPAVIQVGALLPGLLSHFHDISYDGHSLDIVVPGWLFYGNLYSAGTSNSAALAAGMIANFWSEHPGLSHYQVKKRVIETARDMVFDLKADSIFWRIGGGGIQRIRNLDRKVLGFRRLWNDVPGRDDYYGYGMLHFEDLYEDRRHREVEIDPLTGSVDGYQAPTEGKLSDYPQDFIDWYNEVLVTGIEEPTQATIRIYPNPARDILNVSGESGAQYVIFNTAGKKVMQGALGDRIDVRGLGSGMYLLHIHDTRSSGKLWSGRFIKN